MRCAKRVDSPLTTVLMRYEGRDIRPGWSVIPGLRKR
jgi:hypothetical protein